VVLGQVVQDVLTGASEYWPAEQFVQLRSEVVEKSLRQVPAAQAAMADAEPEAEVVAATDAAPEADVVADADTEPKTEEVAAAEAEPVAEGEAVLLEVDVSLRGGAIVDELGDRAALGDCEGVGIGTNARKVVVLSARHGSAVRSF
jgi:hypothetical protein